MSDIVKQQSKRFQRIFGNLPKQYGYCVTTENGISIVRDCKRWHFEIVGADKHVAKPHNRCVTVFVWDSTGTYRLADKTKDIQMQAQSIKNPEDESKNTQIFMKIKDAIDDMTRAYNELRNLDSEIVEEEQSYDALEGFGSDSSKRLNEEFLLRKSRGF